MLHARTAQRTSCYRHFSGHLATAKESALISTAFAFCSVLFRMCYLWLLHMLREGCIYLGVLRGVGALVSGGDLLGGML